MEEEEEEDMSVELGCYRGKVRLVVVGESAAESAAEETLLLWGFLQPTLSAPNAFVSQSSLHLRLDACGQSLSILQSPSSLATPGVTGAVMWDSGVVLAKFLENAADSGLLCLHDKKVVELGSGCGLVGCIAALLGARAILTDLPDRLRLLKKNVEANLHVGVARQCLTPDAVHALDEAVAVARRRGHAQTTSLHAVSALLSLSPSALRDACARARNTGYSTRLQFKALELCLSVSLDRVPSSQLSDDPPVSNSLMAAIKRSQANQRRHPENFHLYHQISQQQNQNSISCVKVELQQLILSILDDPVVSRVFGEAGFRSSDIKLAIIRPLPHLLRYPRHRGPPLFLCNLSENPDPDPNSGRRGFSFPFSGFPAFFHGDENSRRIGEVLAREKGRNPLLMGVCAYDTLNGFIRSIEMKENGVLPQGISGLNIISIENEISKQINENFDRGFIDEKFEQMGKIAEQSSGPGLVVNYGDLKMFVTGDHCSNDAIDSDYDNSDNDVNGGLKEAVSYLVGKLTKLMQIHGSKVWLMGAVASYEIYLKFVTRFPSLEKDCDLQILPITSLRPCLAESYPKSSLMESFVPFGGLFSKPSELKGPFNGLYQSAAHCNEKSQEEIIAVSKERVAAWVSDQYQSSLPSWLQTSEPGTNKGTGAKTKEDGLLSRVKVIWPQKTEDNLCQQRLHQSSSGSVSNTREVSAKFPTIVGFQFVEDKKEITEKCADDNTNAAANGNYQKNGNSFMSINFQKMPSWQSGVPFSIIPKSTNQSTLSEVQEKPLKPKDVDSGDLKSPKSFSNSSTADGSGTSLTSASSVITDLGLGLGILSQVPGTTEPRKPTNKNQQESTQDLSRCSASGDLANGSVSNPPVQSSSSCPDIRGKFDSNNFKMIFKALTDRVGWQDEAASVISRTIAQCRTRNSRHSGASPRGDIWFNFTGPDRCGKRKLAVALADVMYGCRKNFIHVDLGVQDRIVPAYKFSDHQEVNGYDLIFRGKTVVDFIAGELCQKPLSVVFLENVDKADALVEKSLSQAIRTGKFSDSHGREVSITNTIFVTTISPARDKGMLFSPMVPMKYSEEMISRIQRWPMQILIEHTCGHKKSSPTLNVSFATRKCSSNSSLVNKRKLIITNEIFEQGEIAEMAKRAYRISTKNLDLNLPAEENESRDTSDGNFENLSKDSKPWLQDFFKQVDENVVFKHFDFNSMSEKISSDILENFHKFVNPDCLLEIDSKVMDQLLASVYLSDRERVEEDWVEQVLTRAFAEVSKRYHLTAQSVVKLVACKRLLAEEQTVAGSLLPTKIILN